MPYVHTEMFIFALGKYGAVVGLSVPTSNS